MLQSRKWNLFIIHLHFEGSQFMFENQILSSHDHLPAPCPSLLWIKYWFTNVSLSTYTLKRERSSLCPLLKEMYNIANLYRLSIPLNNFSHEHLDNSDHATPASISFSIGLSVGEPDSLFEMLHELFLGFETVLFTQEVDWVWILT